MGVPPSDGGGQAIVPLGRVADVAPALRAALLHALKFKVYREHFAAARITERDVRDGDPVSVLRHAPLLEPSTLSALADESIETLDGIVDVEVSSGTTGTPKRRLITAKDACVETELLARLFEICGIGPRDRVACVDTGPLTLMASFTGALDVLGVSEAYAYTVSPDAEATVDGLIALDPTVIVTIPSIIERFLGALEVRMAAGRATSLRGLVYAGEALSRATRDRLEHGLGLEVFAYYGASETSALGVECGRHTGVHLLTDQHFIELDCRGRGDERDAEIVVTTLRQEGLPLVRYPLGDIVRPIGGACPCGLPLPRVDVIGRADATVSVLGTKLSYASLRDAVYRDHDGPRHVQIVLDRGATEMITLRLPARLRDSESTIRKAVLRREPELAFLVGAGFVTIDLEFVDSGVFEASRKRPGIVDLRDSGAAPARRAESGRP